MKSLPKFNLQKSSKKTMIILIVLLLVIAAIAVILILNSRKNKIRENMEAAFTTETAVIERQTLTNSISATGTVESAETKTVNTKMTNIEVAAVYVKEGDYVEEGTIICEFDSSDYEKALAEAQNNYSVNQQIEALQDDYTTVYNETIAQAEEGLADIRKARDEAKDAYNETRTAVESAKAAFEAAAAESNSDSDNYETLKAAYEQAKAASEKAKAAYEQAQAEREKYQESYEAAIEKAQYDYDKAVLEEQLISETQEEKTIDEYTELIEDCVVKADMSGVITSLNVTEGNNFEGGDIYTIQDNEHFIVSSTVDEYDISSLEKGMTAYIKTDATGDTEMTGELTYVAIAPSSTGGAMGAVSSSASYRIEVTIHDPDSNLRAGMTAKLSIALEESPDALIVPYDAVTTGPDGTSTITVDADGEKKTITVETGLETDYYTEIISDEISEGMTVYLSTPMTVSDPENEEEMGFPGMDGGMPGSEMPAGGGMPDGDGRNGGVGNGGGMPAGGGPGGF